MRGIAFYALCLVFYFKASASVYIGGGLGLPNGLTAEVGYSLNPFVFVRMSGSYLPTTSIGSLASHYLNNGNAFANGTANFHSKNIDLGLELIPFPSVPLLSSVSFIVSVMYLDANLDYSQSVNGNIIINGKNYTVSNGEYSFSVVNSNKFAPYFGATISIIRLPFVNLILTGGFSKREIKAENLRYNLPGVQLQDITAELNKTTQTLWYPSLALLVRFTL